LIFFHDIDNSGFMSEPKSVCSVKYPALLAGLFILGSHWESTVSLFVFR
jgi:hypothetical protein